MPSAASILTRRPVLPGGGADSRIAGQVGQLAWPLSAATVAGLSLLESPGVGVVWLVCLAGLLGLCRLLGPRLNAGPDIHAFAGWSLVLVTWIGMAMVLQYRSLYGSGFAPDYDDSFYAFQIRQLASGGFVAHRTAYELVMAGWYHLVHLAVGRVEHVHLLCLNWAIGAACAVLAWQLPRLLLGLTCPAWLAMLCLVGHATFTDTIGHLYRDGLMLLAFLGCLLAAGACRYLLAGALAVLCGTVRAGNGLLAILAVLLVAISRTRFAARKGFLALATVGLIASVVAVDQFAKLGDQLRTVGLATQQEARQTILERAMRRGSLYLGRPQQADDTHLLLYRFGTAGQAARPAVTLFAPFGFPPLHREIKVVQHHRPQFWMVAWTPEIPMIWLTVCTWLVTGPLILMGLVRAGVHSRPSQALLAIFLILLLGVTYVSYQPRHSCVFILLLPCMIALGLADRGPEAMRLRRALAGVFLLGITLRNVLSWAGGGL